MKIFPTAYYRTQGLFCWLCEKNISKNETATFAIIPTMKYLSEETIEDLKAHNMETEHRILIHDNCVDLIREQLISE